VFLKSLAIQLIPLLTAGALHHLLAVSRLGMVQAVTVVWKLDLRQPTPAAVDLACKTMREECVSQVVFGVELRHNVSLTVSFGFVVSFPGLHHNTGFAL